MESNQLRSSHSARRNLAGGTLSNGLPFSRTLVGHTSCINANAWSSSATGGQQLATGGDDRTVKIWNIHDGDEGALDPTAITPTASFEGHVRTIFKVAWSADSSHVVSGSTDETVRRYDASTGQCEVHSSHEGTVRDVSCHPQHHDLFISSGEDGNVYLNDARLPPTVVAGTIAVRAAVTGAAYHPKAPELFVTVDSRGRCSLRDSRMAFQANGGNTSTEFAGGEVRRFVSTLRRREDSSLCNPEAVSVSFDSNGSMLAVLFSNFRPVIYSPADDHPLAVLSGPAPSSSRIPNIVPSGTYSNCCTIKHGSFGAGPAANMYTTGSDDFRAYAWRLPDVLQMQEMRQEIPSDDWPHGPDGEIGFTTSTGCTHVIPMLLNEPAFCLTGHYTIVNSSLFHPVLPMALTTGVESFGRLHSAVSSAYAERTPTEVRQVPPEPTGRERQFVRAMSVGLGRIAEQLFTGDEAAIVYFDHIIREEGGTDDWMFTARACGETQPRRDRGDDDGETAEDDYIDTDENGDAPSEAAGDRTNEHGIIYEGGQ